MISPPFPLFLTLLPMLLSKIYKNSLFFARMTIKIVLLHNRNLRYGNEYDDKGFRYEIF